MQTTPPAARSARAAAIFAGKLGHTKFFGAARYFRNALAFFVTGLVLLKRLLNRGTRHVAV